MTYRIEGDIPVNTASGERRFLWLGSIGVALLFAAAAPRSVFAGSIFMKNGYIIQGRIVDRNPDGVVLGWPNGKVAIAMRFIASVQYEHSEEERIRQLEQARKQQEEDDGGTLISLRPETDDIELPESLERFVEKYQPNLGAKRTGFGLPGVEAVPIEPGSDPLPGGVAVTLPSDVLDPPTLIDPPVDVENTVVGVGPLDGSLPGTVDGSRPVEDPLTSVSDLGLLGETIVSEALKLSLRPPRTWTNESAADYLSLSESKSGLRASFNVVSLERGSLSPEDFVELLRNEQEANLPEFQLLSEGPSQVGETRAYEIDGRCFYRGEFTFVVRQVLVLIDDRVWLFSAFVPDARAEVLARTNQLVSAVLETVRFFP